VSCDVVVVDSCIGADLTEILGEGLNIDVDIDVDGVYERRPKPLCPHLEITLQ